MTRMTRHHSEIVAVGVRAKAIELQKKLVQLRLLFLRGSVRLGAAGAAPGRGANPVLPVVGLEPQGSHRPTRPLLQGRALQQNHHRPG